MISLRARDVVADATDLPGLQQEFRTDHCVVLRGLLDSSLYSLLLPMIETGVWQDKTHDGIGTEIVLDNSFALDLIHFAVNSPAFLSVVKRFTDCAELSWFDGRIYRFIPGSGHHDSWHDDVDKDRLVGMSINLSSAAFEGGCFQLRDRVTGVLCREVVGTLLGDAHLFRISPSLQHRVESVVGGQPRTAFAGWFRSGQPDLLSRIKTAATSQ